VTTPLYDAAAFLRLAERTEYEAWLLEAVYALVEQELFPAWPDGLVYPVDRSKAQFFVHARANIVIGDWRPGFLNVGAPLVCRHLQAARPIQRIGLKKTLFLCRPEGSGFRGALALWIWMRSLTSLRSYPSPTTSELPTGGLRAASRTRVR